ncbi:adenosylmethionine decarboxylase [uncultured Algibacter sp.]|uniref:adenosylmethionine decarboxylase n=1 Tax=uncultured Algibacter sp. TaxID=298659 RepID=UPI003217350E
MDTFLGHQTTVDFYGCKSDKISSCKFIEATLLQAAKLLNLTVVNTTIHSFSPIGVSGVIVIEESHIAIHTWPEHHYIAIDFFTCNTSYNLESGLKWLKAQFKAERFSTKEIKRGSLKDIQDYKA